MLTRIHDRAPRLRPALPPSLGRTVGAHHERGSVAVFVAAITPALLLVLGVVLDLGEELRAQRTATAAAQEAARAGAEAVDLSHYRTSREGGTGITVSAPAAAAAARSYLSAAGYSGTVALTGPTTLSVTVTVTQPTRLLGAVGISSWTATETAQATLQEG